MRRSAAVGVGLLLASMTPLTAWAGETDEQRGKRLYEEGQAAMASKDYPTACSRFQQSYQASGIAGALLNWADCEETRGRVATALALWNEGAAKVIRDEERHKFVEQRINAIQRRVPHVRITIVSPDVTNAHVLVDGAEVDATKPVPVDPGVEHPIVGKADGYRDDQGTAKLDFGESVEVRLFQAPQRVSSPHTLTKDAGHENVSDANRSSSKRALVVAGFATGGVGVLGIVGFAATSGAIVGTCKGHLGTCPSSERGTVKALGIVNAVSLGVGIAGLATGSVLLAVGFTGKSDDGAPKPVTSFYAGPTGLGVEGSF